MWSRMRRIFCKNQWLLYNVLCLVALSCPTLCDPLDCSLQAPLSMGVLQARILEWVAVPSLQGIFPTQGLNPGPARCRQILYCPSHQGSPRILEQGACPFSKGSSWPMNRTRVSCIAGRSFTIWAPREGPQSISAVRQLWHTQSGDIVFILNHQLVAETYLSGAHMQNQALD